MAIFPIVNLWFNDLLWYENDRYGYFASFHFYFFITILLFAFRRKYLHLLIVPLLIVNLFFSIKMIVQINHAGKIYNNLINSYEWHNEDVAFVGIPQTYNGLYMFGNYDAEATSFKRAMELFGKKPITGRLTDISHFNMKRPADKIDIGIKDSVTLKIMHAQGGTWFWRNGKGLKNYESDDHKITLQGWYYDLELKSERARKMTYLSVVDGGWNVYRHGE